MPLDFAAPASLALRRKPTGEGRRAALDRNARQQVAALCLPLIRGRLGNALAAAQAAEAVLATGQPDTALRLALDVEVFAYEANTLLNAASLLCRIARDKTHS